MARYIYSGSGPVAWDTFVTWSNCVSVISNGDIETAKLDMYPSQSRPSESNTLLGQTIFYGNAHANGSGVIEVLSPYTTFQTGGTIIIKNVFISTYSISILATTTYPAVFNGWYTGINGGGTLLTTSTTLTITNTGVADYSDYYAYFT